jgi:CheY-like chemotaxis protein
MKQNCPTVVYVDDDPDDREFLYEAIREVDPSVKVVLIENGAKALDYLNALKNRNTDMPSLVILDINMPYLDGKETFERIKSDPGLNSVPIVIFTSSESPYDKALFREKGAELITKPDNLSYMMKIASYMLSQCA